VTSNDIIRQPAGMKMGYNWINIIQDYLLPPTCILCGNSGFDGRDLCASCYQRLLRNNLCCYRCAEIFATPTASPILCGRCLSSQPAFDETYAPFIYHGEMRHLITSLKFGAHYKNARLLGLLLAEHLKITAQRPELILPVPLHKTRYRERGFNQAIEIAKTVSRQLQIPLDLSSCLRHRDTPHQTALTARQRRKNMKNAFSIIKPLHAQHIAILDDVMTTGSTAHELASLLKKTGASRVDVWVCARA
jgi:ComF family protein